LDPQVTVEANGKIHIVCRFEDRSASPDIFRVKYLSMNQGETTAAIETVDGSDKVTFGMLPRIAVRRGVSPSVPWIVWSELTNVASSPVQIFHSNRSGGTWAGHRTQIGQPGLNDNPDVFVDASDSPHFSWIRRPEDPAPGDNFLFGHDEIYHQKLSDGSATKVNGADPGDGSAFFPSARLLVDSRGQPNVVWPGLRYAKRVKNPNPIQLNTTWHRQDRIVAPNAKDYDNNGRPDYEMSRPYEAAISRNDQIHVVDFDSYTRTMEYGLGTGDSEAHIKIFPGGTVDVTDGNLMCTLPLFTTKGAS